MRPGAVNPASGASGLMGFTPATAKAYGINPLDPEQAIPTAAKMFSENLQRFNGNVEDAVAAHFAGPDRKLWGPKTSQYVENVSNKFQQFKQGQPMPATPQNSDPLLAMAQSIQNGAGSSSAPAGASQSAPQSNDPILAMAQGIASAKGAPAGPGPQMATPPGSTAPQGGAMALDLAAGGASPDTWSTLQQIGSGAWHGISSLANNAANLVEKGVAAGANAVPGVRGSAVGDWLSNTANSDVAAQSAADQRFKQTATPGEQASAIVAPMVLPTSGALRVGNAIRDGISALPGMGNAVGRMIGAGVGNAATGAGLSAGTAIDSSQPYWPQVGQNALFGAGTGVAVPAIAGGVAGLGRAAYNAARPLFNPRDYVGQQFANAVGNDAAQVANNIRNAPAYVAGSAPTTAQAGATPFLVQTEKATANSNPTFRTALEQRNVDNNDARWQALTGIAGTPADMQAAQAARDAAASPLYQQAHQSTANVGPAFMRYAQIPEMQQAMQTAQQNAALDAAVGRGVAPVWPTPTSNTINGSALDYTSRALGDMIGEAQRAGANSRAASLATLKNSVDNWTQRYIPGVQAAKAAYAQGSVPINTMEVGQQIANGLGTRGMNAGQVPQIQLMPYRSAFTQAMNSGDAANFGIDANALGTLQGIGQDLQRATVSNSIRSPGSDTAYNLAANGWLARQLYGQNFQGGAVGRVLGSAAQAAGAAGGAALFGPAGAGVGSALGSGVGNMLNGSRVGNRLNEQLADMLINPQGLLPYLDARAAGPTASRTQMLAQALGRRLQYLPALVAPQLTAPTGP